MSWKGQKVRWLIADIDNYLQTGKTGSLLTQHHVTVIPAMPLEIAQMNTTDTIQGGYVGSQMIGYGIASNGNGNQDGSHTGTLDNIYNTYIAIDFNDHVITYNNLLSYAINDSGFPRVQEPGFSGSARMWEWYSRNVDLMSEANVFGTISFSTSGFDLGFDNRQYAIFRLNPKIAAGNYWLKDIAYNKAFSVCYNGSGNYQASSSPNGVRPRFLIG